MVKQGVYLQPAHLPARPLLPFQMSAAFEDGPSNKHTWEADPDLDGLGLIAPILQDGQAGGLPPAHLTAHPLLPFQINAAS
jgi:hypothetical protein